MTDIRSIAIDSGLKMEPSIKVKENTFSNMLEKMRKMDFSELVEMMGLSSEIILFDNNDIQTMDDLQESFKDEMTDLFMGVRLMIDLGECNGVIGEESGVLKKIRLAIKEKDRRRKEFGLPSYRETLIMSAKEPASLDDVWKQRECWKYINEVERVIESKLQNEVSTIDEIVNCRNVNGIPSFRNFIMNIVGSEVSVDFSDVREHFDEISGILTSADGSSYIVNAHASSYLRSDACPTHQGIKKIHFVNGYSPSECKEGLYHLVSKVLEQTETDSRILDVLCDAPVVTCVSGSRKVMQKM